MNLFFIYIYRLIWSYNYILITDFYRTFSRNNCPMLGAVIMILKR